MTPAQKAGLVIGQKYVLKSSDERSEWCCANVAVFTFIGDDGTSDPRFSCPESFDEDGWTYIGVENVESYVAPVSMAAAAAESNVGITITIVGGLTEITVARGLTSSEVKSVMDIVNKVGI